MSSVKKQKYRLSKIKHAEIKRLRDEGIVRLSVPEPKLSNAEILMTCVEESSSSFGKIADTKEEEAMQTNWFGFDQETMLRCVKVLIHKESMAKAQEELTEKIRDQTYAIYKKSLSVNDEDQKVESVAVDADGSKTIVYQNG